ncbi:RNA pyrophosphohydrolase [uncultured archaeon]|nr:RNA pyrophosphohydrolase [uncultured archaeon]
MYPAESKKKPSAGKNEKLPVRKIVGLVVFDGEKFLLLHRKLNWTGWEFPKGHIEEGEDIDTAIKRELFEETGLSKFSLIGHVDNVSHLDNVRKKRTYVRNFLLHVSSNNKVSFEHQTIKKGKIVVEHDAFRWCFPRESVELLTHENMQETMKKAIKMLNLSLEK